MKRIIPTLLLAVLLASCSKDKPQINSIAVVSISGNWKHYKDIDSYYDSNDKLSLKDSADYSKENDYLLLNNDNTGIITELDPGTNKYTSNNLTYSYSNNLLILTARSISLTDTVKLLSASGLIVRYRTKESVGYDIVTSYYSK